MIRYFNWPLMKPPPFLNSSHWPRLCWPAYLLWRATEATRPAQPNFLLMLADDLGWQDVKVYDTVPLCCLNNLKWIVAQIMVS